MQLPPASTHATARASPKSRPRNSTAATPCATDAFRPQAAHATEHLDLRNDLRAARGPTAAVHLPRATTLATPLLPEKPAAQLHCRTPRAMDAFGLQAARDGLSSSSSGI